MEAIWRTRDWFGRLVTFTAQARDHIVQKHDDMADRLDEVRFAIEGPDFINRDRRFSRREIHYRRTPPDPGWIKVVVNYRPVPPQGTWAGEVITAYYVDERSTKEVPLWP